MRKIFISWPVICVIFFGFQYSVFGQKAEDKAYAIFLDNSGSLRSQLAREKEIAKEMVNYSVGNGVVSFFGFENVPGSSVLSVGVGLECTRDVAGLNRQINNVSTIGGQTTLIDAVSLIGTRLVSAGTGKCGSASELNILLITDGEDRVTTAKVEDLIRELKQKGIKVFAIGLIEELSKGSWPFDKSVKITDSSTGKVVDKSIFTNDKDPKKNAKDFLEKITKETGGKVIFPNKKQKAAELIKLLFEPSSVKPK